MPYNNNLVNRIRTFLQINTGLSSDKPILPKSRHLYPEPIGKPLEERQIFGGLVFLVHGKMAFAVVRDDLIVRIDPVMNLKSSVSAVELISPEGNPLNCWALVPKAHRQPETDLKKWIKLGIHNTFLHAHSRDSFRSLQIIQSIH
jgi:hypothetical protein